MRASPDGFITTYVQWIETQTDAPLIYGLASAMALVSAVAPSHLCVHGLPDGDIHPNLYVMLVGRQGIDRKSTAIKYATRLLEDAVPGRRGIDPGSAEGLAQGLADQPQQLLVYSDFGSFFSGSQQRHGGNYMTGLKGAFLPLFDNEPVQRKLAKRVVRCENPRLSILGGVNRSILDSYVDPVDWENGLTSRFMAAYGARERVRHVRENHPQVRDWLKDWLATMAALAGTAEAWGDCIGLTNEAHRLLRCFTHGIEVTTPDDGGPRSFGPRARVRVMIIKTAHLVGLQAGLGWPPASGARGVDWKIDAVMMKAAIRIGMMMFTGALAITATATGDLDMRQRSRVFHSVKSTWTDFSVVLLEAQLLKRRATDVLQSLVAEGTVEAGVHPVSMKPVYRRTGANTRELGVDQALADSKAILAEYSRAFTFGVSQTPATGYGGIPLPGIPGMGIPVPTNGGGPAPVAGSDPFTVDLRDCVAGIFGGVVPGPNHGGDPF